MKLKDCFRDRGATKGVTKVTSKGAKEMKKEKQPTGVDIFCGAGGFSLGFIKAGIEVIAAVDNSADAIATYYTNLCDENTKIIGEIPRKQRNLFKKPHGYRTHMNGRPSPPPPVKALFIKDIFDVSGWDILKAANVEHVDIVMGSPPCQPFSQINSEKKKGEVREYLLFEFGRLLLELNPNTYVMENVPGIVKAKLPDGRNILKTFKEMTSNEDWDLYYDVQAMYIDKIPMNPPPEQETIGLRK